MCWICWINLSSGEVSECKLFEANKVMYHRWPEFSNIWISKQKDVWFWHVRLSIVDLDSRANQPFSIEWDNYVITFNGEIYNYENLRESLTTKYNIHFKTTSDTEVLLYMYKYFWKKMLNYIQWMFAFCIFDKQKWQLFIARDFVWQKPFVYIQDNTGFYFASEIPALFSLNPNFKKEIDYSTLKLYFINNFSHIPNQFCIFKNIEKLDNASYMIVKNWKVVEKERYSSLKKEKIKNKENEVEFLYKKLELMKPKDIDYASFLSWWIDSSFVCSWLKRSENKKTDAYTLQVWKKDEDSERAKYISEKLGLNHHIIKLDSTDYLKSINDFIKILWEPYFHITSIFADEILQEVKKSHKVIFSGWWGDECYYWYNNLLFLTMDSYFIIKMILPNFLLSFIDKITKHKYSTILYSNKDNFKENYFKDNFKKINNIFKSHETDTQVYNYFSTLIENFKEFVDYKNYIDFSYMFWLFIENMHSLVIQWDLIGMKNSVEIRSLFLEEDVIKRAYSISLRKKISVFKLKEWKKILKKQLINIFWKKFINARKIWFWVESDFKTIFENKYKSTIQNTVNKLLKRKIFNENVVSWLFDNFKKNFNLIMKLYTLEIWFENFIDNK